MNADELGLQSPLHGILSCSPSKAVEIARKQLASQLQIEDDGLRTSQKDEHITKTVLRGLHAVWESGARLDHSGP